MRMRFSEQDERAFAVRRDALGEEFAHWLNAHDVPGDPNDAGLLMDWKFQYGDGALDTWTVADVTDFLFGWCTRTLSAGPEDSAVIPASVAAFVAFLAHGDLLAPTSDPPTVVRRYCERNTARFVREMANPANFGMAKSLFGGADAFPDALSAAEELDDPPVLGPVRLPGDDEKRASVRAARVPRQLRTLAAYCAAPGRPLTKKGNLRVADARHLVTALETGDDLERSGFGPLRSVEDVPSLHRLVHLALEAGVVRRRQGRLLAVARFTDLDEVAAYEKVVRAAVVVGLSGPAGTYFHAVEPVRAVADGGAIAALADLLDAGPVGVPAPELVDSLVEFVADAFPGLPSLVAGLVPGWVRAGLEMLGDLGVVASDGANLALTPAGVEVSIALVEEAGVTVLRRPDPATCDAAAIVDLLGAVEEQEWAADAAAWRAARPDPVAAVGELVDEVCAEGRDAVAVMAGLTAVGEVWGEQAVAAAQRQLGGAHDGLVLFWLAERSAIDPSTIEPSRFVAGLVDVLAVAVDTDEPDLVAGMFAGHGQDQQLELLRDIWRLDHPRLPDVLEAIGGHHPVKVVAKAARKALVQHRSRLASTRA